jgi:hypothetical protein
VIQDGAKTVAAENLIAQLHSQGKLTAPRRESQKFLHETKILKVKEPTPYVHIVTTGNILLFYDIQKNGTESLLESQMNIKYDF